MFVRLLVQIFLISILFLKSIVVNADESIDTNIVEPSGSVAFTLSNTEIWPGNGISFEVRVEGENGRPPTENVSDQMSFVSDEENDVLVTSVSKVEKTFSRLSIVAVASHFEEENRKTQHIIELLLEALPDRDLISLFHLNEDIHQLRRFQNNRSDLIKATQLLTNIPTSENLLSHPESLRRVFGDISSLNLQDTKSLRAVILVGGDNALKEKIKGSNYVTTQIETHHDGTSTETEVNRTVSWLEAVKKNGYYKLSVCGLDAKSGVLRLGRSKVKTNLPKNSSDLLKQNCSIEDIRLERRQYPDKIYLSLSQRQSNILKSKKQNRSKTYFNLSMKFSEEGELFKIRAHLRGGSSLRCHRPNLTVDMPGEYNWNLLPDSFANKYYLLAMCGDPEYARTLTLYQLWKSLGFFPLEYRLVEVLINDQTQGLYTLIENTSDALPRKLSQVKSIMRRNFNLRHLEYTVLRYTSTTETIAFGDFVESFANISNIKGSELVSQLKNVLDIDQYLEHLAIASIFKNGDYIDERWFIQQPYLRTNAEYGHRYRIMKWDPDTTYRGCHYGSDFAYKDPWALSFCVESDLGKALLENAELYDSYVDVLEKLLQEKITYPVFSSAVANTVDALSLRLDSDEKVLNMNRFHDEDGSPVSADRAKEKLRQTAAKLLVDFENRRSELFKNISNYRQFKAKLN